MHLKPGFRERIKGSHQVFTEEGIDGSANRQPQSGKAKAYQVRKVRNLILTYKLRGS